MRRVLFTLLLPGLLSAQQFRISRLNIYGNRRTRTETIQRELVLAAGDSVSSGDLLHERGWLLRQRMFKRVEFQIKPGADEQDKQVLMVVQEHGIVSGSPILSNNDLFGWYAGGRFRLRNLTGRAMELRGVVQLGGIQNLGLEWHYPWFGGRARLFAAAGISTLERPYRYSDYRTFEYRNSRISAAFGRAFGRRVKAGVQLVREEVGVSDYAVTFSGGTIDHLRSAAIFLHLDTRDWPLYPRRGALADLRLTWTRGDRQRGFRQIDIDIRGYAPIARNNILAAQAVLSLSRGDLPVYKRPHIGGGNTVRGYPTGYAAGEHALHAGLEYRFPVVYERNPLAGLHAGWAGVIFADAGTAWFSGGSPVTSDWLFSAGFGLHIIWDSFVLRAEYGTRWSGWGFVTTGTSVKF